MSDHRAEGDDDRNRVEGAPANAGAAASTSTVSRAEDVVKQLAQRVGQYAGVLGHNLLWLAARAREEVEDIWAEAQAVRRREQR
jgi:hypothetical protein